MSLPKFPEKDNMPSREEVINQIISSIAMEELGLSHIINAEGEKLQYALGTLEGTSGLNDPLTMEELLKLNESVTNTLNSNMMNQFFLKEKLVKALSAAIMQGPPGPEGPRGPATIDVDPKVDTLDPGSSPTVENIGSDNQHVMLKFGIPKGDTGDVGTILDSFDTLAELEAAHPTGNQGDAYLVDGTLYIWDTKGKKWKSTGGNLRGPAGPQGLLGPQGIQGDQGITGPQGRQGVQGIAGTVGTLKASYESLGKLIEEHPTGAPGDMYYVAPDVYVWDADADEWSNVGRLSGPQGIQGPQGLQGEQGPQGIQGEAGTVGTLKASYETLDKLKDAHPTGLPGDMYYVEPDVYVWDTDIGEWVNIGMLSGPQGIQGKQGAEGAQGMQGEQGVQGQQGPQGIQGPPGAGAGIIPFATGYGDVGLLDSRNNFATNVIFSGFGMSSDPVSITGTGFMLPSGDNFFFPISLAHAITIKRINFTTANWATFNPGAGATVIPYIILAMANQGETTFNFLVNTRVEVTEPWSGGSNIPANSTLYGFSIQDINQTIPVGARLAICCAFDMKNGNPPLLPHGYYFYYAGSIYYE